MKDKLFGNRLKKLRNKMRLIQHEAATKIGLSMRAIQIHESGQMPNRRNLAKYVDFYKCSKDWLLTGKEPIYQNPDESFESGAVVCESGLKYHEHSDDFGITVSRLKEIFDSGDPVLVPTAKAGIHAFQISVRREKQIEEQTKKIDALEKECADLKLRISSLENRLMEGDRRKGQRRQEDLSPPDGVERRSRLDRRKGAKTPLDSPGLELKKEK